MFPYPVVVLVNLMGESSSGPLLVDEDVDRKMIRIRLRPLESAKAVRVPKG